MTRRVKLESLGLIILFLVGLNININNCLSTVEIADTTVGLTSVSGQNSTGMLLSYFLEMHWTSGSSGTKASNITPCVGYAGISGGPYNVRVYFPAVVSAFTFTNDISLDLWVHYNLTYDIIIDGQLQIIAGLGVGNQTHIGTQVQITTYSNQTVVTITNITYVENVTYFDVPVITYVDNITYVNKTVDLTPAWVTWLTENWGYLVGIIGGLLTTIISYITVYIRRITNTLKHRVRGFFKR